MIILPFGDSALLINFEQKIDVVVNQRVIQLNEATKDLEGVNYTIPAYCSLTIGYDAHIITFEQLKTQVLSMAKNSETGQNTGSSYVIPVCYDGEHAPDISEVSELKGLTKEEIIALHTGTTYRVYMLGFVAGFAYLGSLPEALECPRKQAPRKRVAQGAVGLAGVQTGIYPTEAPGGWQLIGQTPIKTFDPESGTPTLLQPGDLVKFRAINETEYEGIKDSVRFGTYEPEVSHG